ncbi:MAG: hypothetical protein K8I27_12045 [Planctomycetes bacterium]|nr:hypothetical protein [Planctomycetota bacterium]
MQNLAVGLLLLIFTLPGPCSADPSSATALDPDQPPDHPRKSIEREVLATGEFGQTTFGQLMQGVVKDWRAKLDPEVIEGHPAEMQKVRTDGFWWDGLATLKVETVDGKEHGYAEAAYNSNNQTFAKGNFRDGSMHGAWLFYTEEGQLEHVRCYANGELDGPSASFSDDKTTLLGQYVKGKQAGAWFSWKDGRPWRHSVYDTDGKLSEEREYDATRGLANYRKFENDAPAQAIIAWRRGNGDSPVATEDPKTSARLELLSIGPDGQFEGWQTLYHPYTCYRQYDVFFVHGAQNGPFIEYDKYGAKPVRSGHRLDGVDVGAWVTVDDEGKTREFTRDSDGLFHGRYTTKTADGRLISDATFEHGKAIKIKLASTKASALDKEYYEELDDPGAWWAGRGDVDEIPRPTGRWRYTRDDESLAAEGEYIDGRMAGTWKYYYANGVSLRFEAEFVGDLMNGKCTKYDEQGSKVESGSFQNGARTGDWTGWHTNGQVAWTGTYRPWRGDTNESKSALWRYFREDGTPRERGEYDDWGSKTGRWEYFDEGGELNEIRVHGSGGAESRIAREAELLEVPEGFKRDAEKMNGTWVWMAGEVTLRRAVVLNNEFAGLYREYYPNDKLKIEGALHGEVRTGTWTSYTIDGKPAETIGFAGGKKHGPYKAWRIDGSLMKSGEYANDAQTGTWRSYHPDGKTIATELSFGPSGEYEGQYRVWASNGQLVMDGQYAASHKHGEWREWWANGKLKTQGTYKDGLSTGVWKSWTESGDLASEKDHGAEKK